MSAGHLRSVTNRDVSEIKEFIRRTVEDAGCGGAVVAVSGGVDSAVVSKLCADALGPDRVVNVFMPASVTPAGDYGDTRDMSMLWGTEYRVVDIQPAVDAFLSILSTGEAGPLEKGNISSRCRMVVMYDTAKRSNLLVAGTSNRSERMTGYFTKFGDGACDFSPIADLYKTQVWQMAGMIGVPRSIIEKVPTAGLWEGQTDETDIGLAYDLLDRILECISQGLDDRSAAEETGTSESEVSGIRSRIRAMEHKLEPPAHPGLTR